MIEDSSPSFNAIDGWPTVSNGGVSTLTEPDLELALEC
jgi:hypothetical protein